MKYFEFGEEHPERMGMLHGGGVCYRGALPVAEEMAKIYRVVLVACDGFNPDEPETEFQSVQDRGYAFTYKVFPNMGHGTLAGEYPEQFSREVQAAHQRSLEKEKR